MLGLIETFFYISWRMVISFLENNTEILERCQIFVKDSELKKIIFKWENINERKEICGQPMGKDMSVLIDLMV